MSPPLFLFALAIANFLCASLRPATTPPLNTASTHHHYHLVDTHHTTSTSCRDLSHPPPQIPGVPIMYLAQHRYTIERLPEATVGGAPR